MSKIPIRHIPPSEVTGHIVVRTLDELLAGQDMVVQLHRHSFYFILFVEKGSGEHTIDFVSYPVADGSVFFLRPGQVHELSLAKDGQGLLVQISEDFYIHADALAKQILKKAGKRNHFLLDEAGASRIHVIMQTIATEVQEKRASYLQAIQLNLQLFCIELLRQQQPVHLSPKESNIYNQQKLEAFQDLVADYFTQQKQVSWYASQLHFSVYQLNAVTKTLLGKTASSVISDYILLEAKRQLLATSNQINQISWCLGYQDVSYFIRFFKKHTGYSPESFRVNLKQVP